ncbi:MAG: hypothetical protein ACRD1L_08680, partial [Terriglobales bacterium]
GDPGPGPERLTVRLAAREAAQVRTATRSRDSLVALRRLFAAGAGYGALPAGRSTLALEPRRGPVPPATRSLGALPGAMVAQPQRLLGAGRPIATGWSKAQLAVYRAAHNSNLPWAERLAAMRELEAGTEPAALSQPEPASALVTIPSVEIFWALAPIALLLVVWAISRKPTIAPVTALPSSSAFKAWLPSARTALAGAAFGS